MRRLFVSLQTALSHFKNSALFALFFLLMLCVTAHSFASTRSSPLDGELKESWYSIGHYSDDGRSEIINADFFLSPDGQTNPQAEYEAFTALLKRYFTTPRTEDLDTLCLYPSRITMLSRFLPWVDRTIIHRCTSYMEERKPDQIRAVSFMYASGYFDSPSSYFGHTLLRLKYGDDVLNQRTLNASINYGATSTDHAGGLSYIVKGLFGRYDAVYRMNNDFLHSHRYTNAQLRDLWEYELSLTPDQIRFVSEHSWELQRARFAYFFFNDNCAHRILNLIERSDNLPSLGNTHGFWLIPSQAVTSLDEAPQNLIQKEIHHPSLKSTFSNDYQALSALDKQRLSHFIKAGLQDKADLAADLPPNLLLLLLDYYDIQIAKLTIRKKTDSAHQEALQSNRRILLHALLLHPAAAVRTNHAMPDNAPTLLTLPKTSVLRVGYSSYFDTRDTLTLRYQAANNDLLDTPQPGQELSRFIMGAIELEARTRQPSHIKLRTLTIFDLANLNTDPLPLALTDSYSWGLRAGYDQRSPLCRDCGTINTRGSVGKAYRFSPTLLGYSLAGLQVNDRRADRYNYASLITENGLLLQAGRSAFDLSLDTHYNPFQDHGEVLGGLEARYRLDRSKDIRLEHITNFDGDHRLSLRVGFYFN